jgi:hypothetical protein
MQNFIQKKVMLKILNFKNKKKIIFLKIYILCKNYLF